MRVWVRTPSRLHLGIIDLSRSLGRGYGSLGVAIEEPGYELVVESATRLEVVGPREVAGRVRRVIRRMGELYGTSTEVKATVLKSIPSHVGLGSTTQLVLGVATAITKLHGVDVPLVELAEGLGRGKRSGVGTYAFAKGGFVLDGGVRGGFPPLVLRLKFPERWRFVMAIPPEGRRVSERGEDKLFERIKAKPSLAREICHLLVMGMLPSLVEQDAAGFGRALSRVQRLVGRAFSPYQGGVFRGRVVSKLVGVMLRAGALGAGQSSWGPTVYGLAEDEKHAREIKREVDEFLEGLPRKASSWVTKADNLGARVRVYR